MAISPTFCRCATRIGCGWRRWNCRRALRWRLVDYNHGPAIADTEQWSIRSYSRRRKRGDDARPVPKFFPSFSQNRKFFQSVIGYRHALQKNFSRAYRFHRFSRSALAAVTSFLLSAKIGIAGSVIGVAAGSIVSAVRDAGVQERAQGVGGSCKTPVPFVTNDKDGTDGAGKSGDDATTVIAPPNPRASRPRRCPRRNPMRPRS